MTAYILDFEAPLPSGLLPSSFWNGTLVAPNSLVTNQYASQGIIVSGVSLIELGQGHAPSGANGLAGVGSGQVIDYDAPLTFTFVSPADGFTPGYTDYFFLSGDRAGGSNNTVIISA